MNVSFSKPTLGCGWKLNTECDSVFEQACKPFDAVKLEELISRSTLCATKALSFLDDASALFEKEKFETLKSRLQSNISALIFLRDFLNIQKISLATFEKKSAVTIPQKTLQIIEVLKSGKSFSSGPFLGKGCFGSVSLVKIGDHSLAEKTILKTPLVDGFFSPKKLEAEAALLVGIFHENIIGMAGYCYSGHRLLMYYANRNSFASNLEKTDIYIKTHFSKIFIDVASALEYLHSIHLSHFDLHLGNILLEDLPTWKALLTDFELSSLKSRHQAFTRNTEIPSPQMLADDPDQIHKYRKQRRCSFSSKAERNPDSTELAKQRETHLAIERHLKEPITDKADIWAFGICLISAMASGLSVYQLKKIRNVNYLRRSLNFSDSTYLLSALKRHDGRNRELKIGMSSKEPYAIALITEIVSKCLSVSEGQRPAAKDIKKDLEALSHL